MHSGVSGGVRTLSHKTFISYKYSESCGIRDRICEALDDDARYYKGETSESPDLTDLATETIKARLRDMIFDTSVTIVVLSPHMRDSEWMDWEIRYSLRQTPRNGRASRTNGIVCVLGRFGGGYDWLRSECRHNDGHSSVRYESALMLDVINDNRSNKLEQDYYCRDCNIISADWGSYASIVIEDDFVANPGKFIDIAYEKSQREAEYNICKNQRA